MVWIGEIGSPVKVPVPVDSDGSLPVKRFERYFPGAVGLCFSLQENDVKMPVTFGQDDTLLLPPEGGWDDKMLFAVRPSSCPPKVEELPVDGDLAAFIGRYALYYTKDDNFKRCAIPLTTTLAATFRHGENKSIKIGDVIKIRSWLNNTFEVETRAVKFVEELDTIILQSVGSDLCNEDLVFESVEPQKGMRYLMMGFSITHNKTNHLSLSTGIIASDISRKGRFTGSSGSFKGDSGASCWNEGGRLMGMQVEVEKVPHTKDNKGRPASPASGGRCCIVAMRDIITHIQDLVQSDSDMDSAAEDSDADSVEGDSGKVGSDVAVNPDGGSGL